MKLTRVSRLLGRRALGATGGNPLVNAAASIVFHASASSVLTPIGHAATASIVFSHVVARHTAFAHTASASIVFHAIASMMQTHGGAASASIVFAASAANHAAGTKFGASRATIRFRARSRGKRPGINLADGYLGRYQLGQDVPLQIQCVDSHGAPAIPDVAPLARLYRDGAFVRAVRVPLEADPEITGRFRGFYTLGNADGLGHYTAVYLFSILGLARGGADQFEVVAGGDPSGPVLAAYSLARPDGDYLLAHLAAGRLAAGQTPYLDEGI